MAFGPVYRNEVAAWMSVATPRSMGGATVVGSGGGGGDAWISQVALAGEGSTRPAPSVARTAKLWLPTPRPAYSLGLAHGAKALASSWQANVTPAAVLVKVKVAAVSVVGLKGRPVSVV